ncbi:hypothetical protein NZD88_20800 [Chryseobacterium antibioticum]|uniref:DUF3945 domain-containing protein n=1 Tax=Chryseobacterium pyrolae TaxID=2987481 RepID=A0ABT2IP79_9FLAO|nr:hypothetical protein [Chryseobacterium pyrolae]MCT2410002.1 hypothetical protein [Chryseobacterium pyrolae]
METSINPNNNLKVELKITETQIKAFTDYFEYGLNSDNASLTATQMAKIPDVIDNNLLNKVDKFMLATEGLELVSLGVKYHINKDDNIVRSTLSEDLIEIPSIVKNKDVKFNDSISLSHDEIRQANQLIISEKQKEILLKNGSINIPKEEAEDELKVSLSINKDGNINATWYNGEEETFKKEEIFPKVKNEITKDTEPKDSLKTIISTFNEDQTKNFNYLKDQMKFLGFGVEEKLHLELANKINLGENNFVIKQGTEMNHFKSNEITFLLSFNKSKETENVFLNSYLVSLENKEKDQNVSYNVDLKKVPFSAKEAVNLIEGRSVRTEINLKNGQKEDIFVKIDFQNPNENGEFNLNKFFQNYGVNTAEILKKSNVLIANDEIHNKLIRSLEKGNVVPVLIKNSQGTEKLNAVLNPQYKTLNLYDFKMQRLNTSQSMGSTIASEKKDIENNVQQSTQRKI